MLFVEFGSKMSNTVKHNCNNGKLVIVIEVLHKTEKLFILSNNYLFKNIFKCQPFIGV